MCRQKNVLRIFYTCVQDKFVNLPISVEIAYNNIQVAICWPNVLSLSDEC